MKYVKLKILVLLLGIIVLMPIVDATVGIGIKWFTVGEYVNENSQYCLEYGLYNPFDEEVFGYLTAVKDLENIYEAEEHKLIPSETSSKKAIMTKICFNIPKTYKEDCLIGNLLCERTCNEEQVVYNGEVMAAYELKGNAGGTGSATGTSFAAPIKLMVECEPKNRDWTLVYILVFLAIVICIRILWKKKMENGKKLGYKKK
ncbi:MAG: hypothetical protein KAI55_02555 [Candidatus Aenigmarchaeota archaeon]|nr:hypothetical protein [Candidatus Aenigmarchaeota archaeon]